MLNFVLFVDVILFSHSYVFAQHIGTEDFMEKAGFTEQDSCWIKTDICQINMNGDFVKNFKSVQTHNWQLVFGDGNKFGATISIKKGDVITYENGMLTLGNGKKYQLNLIPGDKGLLRRGIVKSSIFNTERPLMSIEDMKLENPCDSPENIGVLYEADGTKINVNNYGNFSDRINAHYEADEKLTKEIESAPQQATYKKAGQAYSSLCAKYGKSVIDGTIDGNIVIGAPIDLVKRVAKSNANQWRLTAQNSSTSQIVIEPAIYEPNTWHLHYHINYNTKTGRVVSFYSTRHFY
jgi:hypothetical protein